MSTYIHPHIYMHGVSSPVPDTRLSAVDAWLRRIAFASSSFLDSRDHAFSTRQASWLPST